MPALIRASKRSDPDRSAPENDASPPPRRLVVELSRRTAADLAWLVEKEEQNKTTVVNRAVQIYRMIVEAQSAGGRLQLEEPDGETQRLVIV